MRNMRYSKRIYLVLFFWVTSVLMMRIPIAYQQGYHSGSEIEEAIDTILSSSPDFIKVAKTSIRKHVHNLPAITTSK